MIDDMQVYIANLGKYNEGELVGDWFSFPLDEEVIAERISDIPWIREEMSICNRPLPVKG